MTDKKETKALRLFREKTETALEKIKSEDFKKSDEMIEYVFKIGDWLFTNELDKIGESSLVRTGGKLTGVFAYLGNKASQARAERDIFEQKKDEVFSELVVKKYPDSNKIMLARAEAKSEMSELEDFVIEKEFAKNNYENMLNATDKMVSFIQSAIKVKEAERFKSNRMHDNTG